ncbi:MAG: insulinase family protein [Spirochaetes bacterium]|nr:insulinase family protein [Spirochaetota bacterium]
MVRKIQLANGIRLIAEKIPHTETCSIGFWQETGSSMENEKTSGFSHFIEHMLFKGTDRYSAYEIARKIDGVGGIINAFTAREYTCYYTNIVAEHHPMALDLLSNMYYRSAFVSKEIDREKQVILEEIKMYEDTPDELIHDRFIKSLWYNDVIGNPVVGRVETINSINRQNILRFYKKNYTNDKLIVAVTGKFSFKNIKKFLENLPRRDASMKKMIQQKDPVTSCIKSTLKKPLEQVHLIIGMPSIKRTDPRRYILYILNIIFGASMSSRLYQKVRENEGICYSIYSYISLYKVGGVFGIYCGTSTSYLKRVLDLIKFEIDSLMNKGITEDELKSAKEQIKGNIILGKESIETRMNRIASEEIYFNRHIPMSEVLKEIEAISLKDISNMIDQLFSNKPYSINTIGPSSHIRIVKNYKF